MRVVGGELEYLHGNEVGYESGYESVEVSSSELRPVVERPCAVVLPTRRESLADIEHAVDVARGDE